VHNQNPQPPGPAVSPSRTVFQRLTNELPRNFPCPFGHTPVLIHVARFHAKPPKMRNAPTRDRHNTCQSPPKLLSPIVNFDSARLTRDPRAAERITQETSGMNPRTLAAAHCFDVLTFWRFDVSAQNHPKREPPQHMAVTSVGTISARRVSPYVTFDFAGLTRVPQPPIRNERSVRSASSMK